MTPLKHPFIRRCINQKALLQDCYKLNTFLSRIEKQSEVYANGDEKLQNNYRGDAFELFAEFFIKSYSMDKRVGISNYEIVDEADDNGVDGFGIGMDAKPATVQVKYRQANYILTTNKDRLSNFKAESLSSKYGVDATPNARGKCNMLIIHTGKELHHKTANDMLSEVRTLNREKLRVFVDDNIVFWNQFNESWAALL